MQHYNSRPIQESHPRDTEGGNITVANKTKSLETRTERKRGRPKGSKNKPKALIDKEVAQDLLGVVKQTLPPELYEEMKEAVRSGKNISTINEAKILMKMMGPPIWQRLIIEAERQGRQRVTDLDPDLVEELPEEAPANDKDLNERIKTYIQLMQFVNKMERDEDQSDNSEKPILEIFARRGADGGRVKILAGYESGVMGGDVDGTGRPVTDIGAIPDTIPERPLDLQDSEQEPPARVLDLNSVRDDTLSGDEA